MRPYPVPGCEVFSPLQEGKKKDSNFSYLSMVMRLTFSTKETTWPVILHETLRDLLPVSLVVPVSGGKNILLATCTSLMRATLALITLSCYNWFTCLSFKSLYVSFHTGDDDVLASTSQWLVLGCHEGNLLQPIRSTTQILVVTCHRYGILRSFLRSHFAGKTVVWSGLFCQAFYSSLMPEDPFLVLKQGSAWEP